MACPTCDHTMQLVNSDVPRIFWCPRCGTLKMDGSVPENCPPKFMERVVGSLRTCDDSIPRSEPGPLTGVLWSKVAHVFCLGSTSAIALCRALGFDPDEDKTKSRRREENYEKEEAQSGE